VVVKKKSIGLSERERAALVVLDGAADDCDDFCYLHFKTIATRSGLDQKVIRRTVRALARKGFAEYGKGLWTDDGEPAGSGYCCTEAGRDFLAAEKWS
jgi:hypothetical protein